jgi:signal transduction histidine kinase
MIGCGPKTPAVVALICPHANRGIRKRPTMRGDAVPLQDNALFRALPADTLAQLDLSLPVVDFAAGEIIFEDQSPGDACYLVEAGTVRISKMAAGSGQETLGFVGPGEFFGELALFYAVDRSARATAVTAVRARTIFRDEFERVRSVAPLELMTAISNAGAERLRHLNSHLTENLADSDRFRDIGVALAMIAHDTRSPLATIQSAAELLQELIRSEERDVEKLLRFSSIIERTAGRALDNIDDLLAGVRGEQERAQSSVDIKDLVHDVALQLEGALRSRDVHFETILNYEGDLLCDRRQLTRALVNLLRNALDAVPDGGTVELTVDREAESVVFAVRDTGCGIPVELQGRIFERRFTHGKKGGTGLGLHQVRNAVERHCGTIEVDSRPDEGTTFRIRIPERRHTQPEGGVPRS